VHRPTVGYKHSVVVGFDLGFEGVAGPRVGDNFGRNGFLIVHHDASAAQLVSITRTVRKYDIERTIRAEICAQGEFDEKLDFWQVFHGIVHRVAVVFGVEGTIDFDINGIEVARIAHGDVDGGRIPFANIHPRRHFKIGDVPKFVKVSTRQFNRQYSYAAFELPIAGSVLGVP